MSLEPQAIGSAWAQLTTEQRAEKLQAAALMWISTDAARSGVAWDSLSAIEQRFAAITLPLVVSQPDPFRDTRSCSECWGRVIVPGKRAAWYCQTCQDGALAEAGHWRDVRYPMSGKRRVKSEAGTKHWHEYAAARPARAERIRGVMADLVRRERETRTSTEED